MRRLCPVLVILITALWLGPVTPAYAQSSGTVPPSARVPGGSTAGAPLETPPQQAPDGFGLNSQWISIFAAQWTPSSAGTLTPFANDYPYVCVNPADTSSQHQYWAQVNLPNGAEIDHAYIRVKDAASDSGWRFWLTGVESGYGAVVPDYVDHGTAATGDVDTPGYTAIGFSFSPPVVVHEYDDINGDGSSNLSALALILRASPTPATPSQMCFFGGAVMWRRTISPAPASATFTDVGPTDFGFKHVEALAASGITGGCSATEFCPNAPLTRVQMAVFLAKALGLHWSS